MILKQGLMSVDEYLALPEEKPYLEYVHGEAVPKPVPSKEHSILAAELAILLAPFRTLHGGRIAVEGRSEFRDPDDPRFLVPDVAYFAKGRPTGEGSRMNPPTLAVEIRSEGQPLASLREKCEYYLAHGVETAWIIDPEERTAELYERGREPEKLGPNGRLTSLALPGLDVPLAELFAALDE